MGRCLYATVPAAMDVKNLTREGLGDWFEAQGERRFRGDQVFGFESVQSGIDGALLHLKRASRDLADPPHDLVAVPWFPAQCLEEKEAQRALHDIETVRAQDLLP